VLAAQPAPMSISSSRALSDNCSTQLRPDVVVNCAAYNFVDKAESEPETAFAVNAWAVRELAVVCRDLHCLLVHYSTDHVFGLDASRSTPWLETDRAGAGERLRSEQTVWASILFAASVHGIWCCGPAGCTAITAAAAREAILSRQCSRWRDRASRCASSATRSARQPARLTSSPARWGCSTRGAEGLFNVTNEGSCSWYEFAKTIFELAKIEANLTAITSAEFGAAARRPPYCVLSTAKVRSLGLSPAFVARGRWRSISAKVQSRYVGVRRESPLWYFLFIFFRP